MDQNMTELDQRLKRLEDLSMAEAAITVEDHQGALVFKNGLGEEVGRAVLPRWMPRLRGDWQPGEVYAFGDWVRFEHKVYFCKTPHVTPYTAMVETFEQINDIELMARTIYGEARGEYGRVDGGMAALIGVGNVILNRVNLQTWFGRSIRDVCLKPYQFSCWNAADANRSKLIAVTEADAIFKQCLAVAFGVTELRYPDSTKGADHYYSSDIAPPKWAVGAEERVRIGKHRFFKLTHKGEKI
eukprot:gene20447-26531_t